MSSKLRLALGIALFLSLVFAVPAFAGGWAVITLDELPTDLVAGEPLTVGFTVRQHGVTPMDGLYPTVTAALAKDDRFVVQAESDGKPGHYTATLTFPQEGNWEWSIQAFSMDQAMPMLNVAAASAASISPSVTNIESRPATLTPLLLFRTLTLGVALIGLLFAWQRKSRLVGMVAILFLTVGISTWILGAPTPEVEAQSELSSNMAAESSPAQAELGRQLFIAKGCITCHYNDRAATRDTYWTIEMGAPDLSNYSAHPDILFIRLKDPASAKSDTKMPNLGLKETEIEALIAFINSK